MPIRKTLSLIVLLFWGSWAWAQDHLRATAFREDPTGQVAFEQLPTAEFQPFSGLLSQGYSHATFWIRLSLDPAGSDEPLILRIRPAYLDEVSPCRYGQIRMDKPNQPSPKRQTKEQ